MGQIVNSLLRYYNRNGAKVKSKGHTYQGDTSMAG